MEQTKAKLLLMGRSGSGKSSMRSIIFSNYSAFDTRRLGATIDIEHSHLKFLGNMTLNLWDCGGQDIFMDSYLQDNNETNSKNHIFQMVQVLIHVFDVESDEVLKDIEIFSMVLQKLRNSSPNCKIFVLIHKMDLVQINKRDNLFNIMMSKLKETCSMYGFDDVKGFPTSIWDESLYKAWSSIVGSMIPTIDVYRKKVKKITELMNLKEFILFEKTTFLVVCSSAEKNNDNEYVTVDNMDPKRFEKISNVLKTYKQSIYKLKANNFQELQIPEHGIYIINLNDNLMGFININKPEWMNNNLIEKNLQKVKLMFSNIEQDNTD
ncbi:probable GTP-binding protein GTR1 [Hanseniaspora guilliermondii]|uniref:GTP-binding protein n=1 Tax=Hanseniaspora guilliermondii TaxID=56406 RepID=A0A1L0FLF2_9ASCO|nr:probable GTP-binding protein GTR1 [Hanseniaspora guilliermondii]